jgi:hypothetical protein
MNHLQHFKSPLAETLDALLADIAIRVQLSETNYNKAVARFHAIQEYIQREGSPLQDRVTLVHAQGSMAIGATISSKLENDEFDIDLIATLDLPANTLPHRMLDLLEQAIAGEPGSRYHGKTTRCTRCIQVQYADGMHLDVTPMVRIDATPEKWGYIYHAPERYATEQDAKIVANPWGFAKHFLEHTPKDALFEAAFLARAREFEAAHLLVEAQADVEPVPAQEPMHAKSMAVIALQLLKRYRNVRYDQRDGRCPPSVMMAKVVADHAGQTATLSEELLHQAAQLQQVLSEAHGRRQLANVCNPTCEPDVFTDRWPGTLGAQQLFINDLDTFIEKLEELRGDVDLAQMQATLAELFGERATIEAVKQLNERMGRQIVDGTSRHVPGSGRIVLPTAAEVAALGAALAPAAARATPKHTHFGSEPSA